MKKELKIYEPPQIYIDQMMAFDSVRYNTIDKIREHFNLNLLKMSFDYVLPEDREFYIKQITDSGVEIPFDEIIKDFFERPISELSLIRVEIHQTMTNGIPNF